MAGPGPLSWRPRHQHEEFIKKQLSTQGEGESLPQVHFEGPGGEQNSSGTASPETEIPALTHILPEMTG